MSTDPGADQRQPTEEEIRAAYEAEIKQISVQQIILENVVTLINMGMRRSGLIPGTEDERDPAQVQIAIEGVRAHMPLVEAIAAPQAQQIAEALSQLQMAFVQITGGQPEAGAEAPEPGPATATTTPASPEPPADPETILKPGEAGPAQKSGRLWVPGQ